MSSLRGTDSQLESSETISTLPRIGTGTSIGCVLDTRTRINLTIIVQVMTVVSFYNSCDNAQEIEISGAWSSTE